MTEDELDLLASAYVDGEATPEEVALVERDLELQARVEAFRAVEIDGAITPPPGLRDRHLTAAMAEFDVVVGGGDENLATTAAAITGEHDTATADEDAAAPVVDLRAAAARRGERDADGRSTNGARRTTRPARTMPSWLPAAAGFVIIGGGLVWAIGQTGDGDDDSTSDATEAAAVFESEEDAGSDDAAAESAEAEMAMDEEEATEESEDAMEDEGGDDATRSEADAAGAAPSDGDADEAADDAEAGFVVPEPLVFLDAVPDAATLNELDDLPEPEPDLELSLCGPEVVAATLGEPIGFIPVDILGEAAELFLFVDGDGTEIRVLVDDDCLPLEP